MSTKRVCICGHFGSGKELLNGQTVKTKILAEELERVLGEDQVLKIDTHGGVKALLRMPFQMYAAMRDCENIVILPANNGLQVLTPLLSSFKLIFKRKIHYAVIGGWLASFISNKKALTDMLKRFDGIYVETNTMRKALEKMGFDNIYVMPNCKALKTLDVADLDREQTMPYKLCTFSRVMKEKGIEDAIEAVKAVNESVGKTVYALDIYGQIDAGQTEWFRDLQATFPDYVSYGGLVPFDKSVEVLKDYFALLFPTRFYTEGIPGTIIDAYASGVPVISAKWESFSDIVDDGCSGVGYTFGNNEELIACLTRFAQNPESCIALKRYCLQKAEEYLPRNAISILLKNME